jgi:predicted nucleotidyltransferase
LDFAPSGIVYCGMRMYDARRRDEAASHRVTSAFLKKLSGTYDVAEAIIFESHARGDQRSDSDLDLAVVLKGQRGDFIDTKLDMAGIAFDVLVETGVLVQALPMWDGDLAHPERSTNSALLRNIAGDGIRLR